MTKEKLVNTLCGPVKSAPSLLPKLHVRLSPEPFREWETVGMMARRKLPLDTGHHFPFILL